MKSVSQVYVQSTVASKTLFTHQGRSQEIIFTKANYDHELIIKNLQTDIIQNQTSYS